MGRSENSRTLARPKKGIGIFGGTFNPVHNAHLRIARRAAKEALLREVVFVPAHEPPHKKVPGRVSPWERYRMLCLALKKNPLFSCSRFEIDRKGKSFSVDTVEYFRGRYPADVPIYLILGSDSFASLSAWRKSERIMALSRFLVFPRPGYPVRFPRGLPREKITVASSKKCDLSSRIIRDRIKKGEGVSHLLPGDVWGFIRKRGLYRERGGN